MILLVELLRGLNRCELLYVTIGDLGSVSRDTEVVLGAEVLHLTCSGVSFSAAVQQIRDHVL